jgi:hypothetical protein
MSGVTLCNIGYWFGDPLSDDAVKMLRRFQHGGISPKAADHLHKDRFQVAYLIARECLSFNQGQVTITEKGQDALEFYRTPEGR